MATPKPARSGSLESREATVSPIFSNCSSASNGSGSAAALTPRQNPREPRAVINSHCRRDIAKYGVSRIFLMAPPLGRISQLRDYHEPGRHLCENESRKL